MNNIVVIAPHPDDETLGCCGTLLKEKKNGSKIHWIIGTSMYEEYGWSKQKILNRDKEIQKVSKKYRFDSVHYLGIPTMHSDQVPIINIVKKIEKIYQKIKPTLVFTPFNKDIHTDHQIISKASISCTKWFRFPTIKKILSYETLSETNWSQNNGFFKPNVFIDISKYLEQKIRIMNIYKTEIEPFPFPRNEKTIRAQSALNGSQSGFKAAEAFELLLERN